MLLTFPDGIVCGVCVLSLVNSKTTVSATGCMYQPGGDVGVATHGASAQRCPSPLVENFARQENLFFA
jgi:NaMN:DMB phosphoribosyltransferase